MSTQAGRALPRLVLTDNPGLAFKQRFRLRPLNLIFLTVFLDHLPFLRSEQPTYRNLQFFRGSTQSEFREHAVTFFGHPPNRLHGMKLKQLFLLAVSRLAFVPWNSKISRRTSRSRSISP